LKRLRDAGCRLALDDFGTGYSSLGYLHRLPIDCVKIDRSFVACLDDPMTGGVVASILNLCRSMQITCVAEGVEDAGQAEALQQLQCRFAQGYHFCPPKPFADIKQSIDETGTIAGLPIISAEHNDLLRSSAN
jgi:EAL domain-containing protein (putative c-di-GMP-specific phosphodiesterase class I)